MRIAHNKSGISMSRYVRNAKGEAAKRLKKLSTGYRINAAGDDASGLAISERMRGQIAGLTAVRGNAEDGISLVRTAEGALAEIHTMLDRMLELSEQSATGTYDETLDRQQLQKEIEQIKQEIDRIAEDTNFNGISLFNGSLEDGSDIAIVTSGAVSTRLSPAEARRSWLADGPLHFGARIGDLIELGLQTESGGSYQIELEISDGEIVDADSGARFTFELPPEYDTWGELVPAGQRAVPADALREAVRSAVFQVTDGMFQLSDDGRTFESTRNDGSVVNGLFGRRTDAAGNKSHISLGELMVSQEQRAYLSLYGVTAVKGERTTEQLRQSVFSVNGRDFLLLSEEADLKLVQHKLGDGVTLLAGKTLGEAAGQLARATGLTVHHAEAEEVAFSFNGGQALRLQIGESSASCDRLSLSLRDMHCDALGLAGIDISSQSGAVSALDTIERVIDSISDMRGGLGAAQNRLDQTIQDLAVSKHSTQTSEALIRDTNMARELTAYTKDGILVQSASAMMAQANQLPETVLQLFGPDALPEL